jgi:stage II sporulation protein GA (sporulation sigma-E factor processing peptidase)
MLVSGVRKMVVYLDQAFLLNGLLDYLLLSACGAVTAAPGSRLRTGLAAALGGLYASLSLVPGFRFLGNLCWQMLFAGALCLIAFGPDRCLPRRIAVLLLLAAAFSGLVLVLTEVFSAPAAMVGSRVYYPVGLGALVLTAGGSYGLMRWTLGRLRHQGGDIARVTVRHGDRRAEFTALQDTGNTLRDPISGLPVLVVDGDLAETFLPGAGAFPGGLQRPMELLEALSEPGARLIPYKTIGVERGMLLAFRPEEVKVDGKQEELLIAFSPVPVSDGGGYKALLGGTV